jgi:hypothetical protein
MMAQRVSHGADGSMHDILVLDVAGTPVRWVDHESAAGYYASGKVRWELGNDRIVLRGGISREHGRRSELEIAAIIAIDGPRWRVRGTEDRPALSRTMVFARDRHVCAYCGGRFGGSTLEMEHVIPSSRGGRTVWQNVVSACRFFGPFEPRVRSRRPRRLEFLGLSRSRRRRGAHALRPRVDWRTQ